MSIKKLFDLEIDEVSVVDRPANQHGLIAFAKNDEGLNEEGQVPEVFDENGDSVDVDVLEHGDVVYDTEGNEFVFVEDGDDDVEKAARDEVIRRGKNQVFYRGQDAMARAKGAGARARRYIEETGERSGTAIRRGKNMAYYGPQTPTGRKVVAGTAAVGIGGAGFAGGRMSKSLGDSVLEDLSKAVTDYDREMVIAKAMDEVEIAKAQAAEAFEYAAAMEDARLEDAFISKAAEYNLPVAPEVFGPILKSIAETLSDDELDLLDELFSAIGDSLYNEIGYVGDTSNSSVLDAVGGLASEFVGKSDVSYEQAYTAMFEANPSAYDAYLAEGR
jgi:hypothetical protein